MAEGFDTARFRSTIDDGFICSICLGVLKNPMQCEHNEHYFCSGCIKKHLEKTSHSCPVCQDKLTVETLRKAPRIVADCVSRYKINCDHAARGCDAVLDLGALQAHVHECDFMPVPCSNDGCHEVVSKRDVKQHELDLCRFKTTTCDDCGKKMPHHEYGGHGCVLRREMDQVKKDLAEVKATQHEMMNEIREGMQRITNVVESVQKSVNSKSTDIVVIAGMDPKTEKSLSSVERFNLLTQTWTQLPALKIPRVHSAAVMFKNQVFVCGGSIKNTLVEATDSIEVLDLNGNPPEWRWFFPKLPLKVVGHKCVVYGNGLLIIGGCTEAKEVLDTIYELLLVPPYSFKLLCHMKKRRAFHGVELFGSKVLIAGGRERDVEIDVEVFDIARNECVEMPPLPTPLYGMQTVRRGDTILLIGGMKNTSGNEDTSSNEIIEYDFKTGESKVVLAMEKERVGCHCVCRENTLIVIGGSKSDPNAVDCLDFLSNSWKKLPSMAEARFLASGVVVNMENLGF